MIPWYFALKIILFAKISVELGPLCDSVFKTQSNEYVYALKEWDDFEILGKHFNINIASFKIVQCEEQF